MRGLQEFQAFMSKDTKDKECVQNTKQLLEQQVDQVELDHLHPRHN